MLAHKRNELENTNPTYTPSVKCLPFRLRYPSVSLKLWMNFVLTQKGKRVLQNTEQSRSVIKTSIKISNYWALWEFLSVLWQKSKNIKSHHIHKPYYKQVTSGRTFCINFSRSNSFVKKKKVCNVFKLDN